MRFKIIRYLGRKSKNMHIKGHILASMLMPLNYVHARIAENLKMEKVNLHLTEVHQVTVSFSLAAKSKHKFKEAISAASSKKED